MPTKIKGLYALCDTSFRPDLSHQELALAILKGGANILQLRMKGEQDLDKVYAVARSIQELKNDFDFQFIINDFVEVALALKVDGIHVGENDQPVSEIKALTDQMLGYSSHSMAEAQQAVSDGADYVALGAIFPTKTKGAGHPVCGLEYLAMFRKEISCPIVAIGGINRSNLQSVLDCGVDAVAMISEITEAEDISERVRKIKEVINKSHHERM